MRKSILQLIGGEGGRPMNKSELARAMALTGKQRPKLRDTLREMEKFGEIEYGKKGRYSLGNVNVSEKSNSKQAPRSAPARKSQGFVGTIKLNPAGHGWFFPSSTAEENQNKGVDLTRSPRFYVSHKGLGTALDGDTVIAKLVKVPGRRPKNSEGKDDLRARVEKVLERRSGKVTGVFRTKGKFVWLEANDERVPEGIRIEDRGGAKNGQIVVVEILEWTRANDKPRGRVCEILGFPGEAGVDVMQIIHQHGVAQDFPLAVLAEAKAFGEHADPKEVKRREDWRQRDVITIDPATAKDYDDAIHVEKIESGWRLAVHIADVSHYVKPDSALDIEARERGNSTYLVDRVIPMLPEELSNGLCSLNPGVDRLTKCAVLDIGPAGAIKKMRFVDAVIKTPRKYSYEEAQDILDHKVEGGRLGAHIREAWNCAAVLRKRRFANGGLDLEMPEVSIILDDDGVPTGYQKEEYTTSHQLIEEFMLVANEAVARKIKNARKPSIYRVHESPDADRLNEYAELARSHGYDPGDLTNRKHIQTLLNEAKGSIEEHAIKLGLLKSLKRACYMATPEGHYGLAKTDYCHFTSPIRRYADLIMHRALQSLLENKPAEIDRTPNQTSCAEISEHISETERTSSSAESESRKLKMLEWLELSMKYEEPPVFEALITEVRSMGLFMECTDVLQKGLVRRDGMPEGHWFYENSLDRFASRRGETLGAGQRITVRVMEVDRVNQRVNFEIVTVLDRANTVKSKKVGSKPQNGRRSGKPSAKRAKKKSTRRRR